MADIKIKGTQSLFEVSWEICNKVGGIHTVIATKARNAIKEYGSDYILIGPDITTGSANPEFNEDTKLLQEWRKALYSQGIRVKIGRWRVEGDPIVVLVDFSYMFAKKDETLKFLWDSYKVDSLSGHWDYIEPVLFGFAAGEIIESYTKLYRPNGSVTAHFHEWMTSSGGLYLRKAVPSIATVFTTHATVLGRSIAGNSLPLYSNLSSFNPDEYAHQFGVISKHSLERSAANYSDAFLTVSDITANECKYLLGREVSMVTPNGFEDKFVWKGAKFDKIRQESKDLMIKVAESCLDYKFATTPLIVGTSGRYEYKNKGIDLFLEALKIIAEENNSGREILAYITVPAGNSGARQDLQAHLSDSSNKIDSEAYPHTTHYLTAPEWDPIVNSLNGSNLLEKSSNVKIIFVPSYLNGDDGIFNKHYYELLAGMDITVFASYYEPWGYTPLESVAFSVPTITTSLAGFGVWVDQHTKEHRGIEVIDRTDTNDAYVINKIAESILQYSKMKEADYLICRDSALFISKTALWDTLFSYYKEAYALALNNASQRAATTDSEPIKDQGEQMNFVRQQLSSNKPTWRRLMAEKHLSERLRPLEVLSNNLWWSWTVGAHKLFKSIDPQLWVECHRNPIALLDTVGSKRLHELESDTEFLSQMDSVYSDFSAYMAEKSDAKGPKIAYFSMEYGLHSSLKIYSGGLGILAGDYLKEASDKNIPLVAVGLLYRFGYFTQRLSAHGDQEAGYEAQNFYKLPISPVRDEGGNWITAQVTLPGRAVTARVWKCEVGRTDLYLLDTDHELNLEEDRPITHHLYGGDWENRLKQEIILGVGGIRALNKLNISQDIYHCNEGHAAFIGLERLKNIINSEKLSFSEALEVVRSSSLFTTHTPVPAGHDAFPESMMRQYMAKFPDKLGISWEQFMNLGKTNPDDYYEKFSMSFLACNLSQEINGVSWLHGEVSKEILGGMWPGYLANELHISYVTNGVHFPTWTAYNMRKLYSKYFPEGFSNHQYDIPAWQKVKDIDDNELWDARLHLKQKLIDNIGKRALDPSEFMFGSPTNLVQIIDSFKPEVLTIGFARRFATYKRAHLLFTNLDRLEKIVNNKERPVQFVFAGKAHPNDIPGQDMIRRIIKVSMMPQFIGKIIFLQNYDMELARKMVQGVDVWLNTPTRPLEASGTSGEKCVMNGVLQFSVLDGWWVEGYKKGAGWMLPQERTYDDQHFQDELDAEMIYATIEDNIAPKYYHRDTNNTPTEWIKMIKCCIADVASNFTTNRMITDYQDRFYNKLHDRNLRITSNDYQEAKEIASWKRRVSNAWDKVRIIDVKQMDLIQSAMSIGDSFNVSATIDLNGLLPSDIGVEVVVAKQIHPNKAVEIIDKLELSIESQDGNIVHYVLNTETQFSGVFDVALRLYAKSDKLPYRTDFALVKWA